MGDLEDIVPAMTDGIKTSFDCTTFIKPQDSNLIVAHNTHNRYSLMLRVFKVYDRKLANPIV